MMVNAMISNFVFCLGNFASLLLCVYTLTHFPNAHLSSSHEPIYTLVSWWLVDDKKMLGIIPQR